MPIRHSPHLDPLFKVFAAQPSSAEEERVGRGLVPGTSCATQSFLSKAARAPRPAFLPPWGSQLVIFLLVRV